MHHHSLPIRAEGSDCHPGKRCTISVTFFFYFWWLSSLFNTCYQNKNLRKTEMIPSKGIPAELNLLEMTLLYWVLWNIFFQMSSIKLPISVLPNPSLSLELFISLFFLFDLHCIDCWECRVKTETSSITIHPVFFFKGRKHIDLNCCAYIFVNSDKVQYAGCAHSCSAKETSFLDWSLYLIQKKVYQFAAT